MMRVLFVTTGLATGGAERQLLRLLEYLNGRDLTAGVVSLTSSGPVSEAIAALGIPLWHLNLERPWRLPLAAGSLVRITRRFQPDVIQGWMYHGNLAALLAAWACGGKAPVVWGVRQSLYDIRREKPATRVVIRLSARWSYRAAAIVYNAEVARSQHEAFGFASAKGLVIGNGFETERWRPDPQARHTVRAELGITNNAPLIGLVARYHPMKGHAVFFEAARRLAARLKDVHFVLAGRGVERETRPFSGWLQNDQLRDRMHLLGERQDIPRLTASLDIACSSSWGEAFSNAIAEALLCAVPVVATDVGDARDIVGEAGRLVPVGDAAALAQAWEEVLMLDDKARHDLGALGRERVLARFGIDAVARRYVQLYREVIMQ